jgi:hypothetical protein
MKRCLVTAFALASTVNGQISPQMSENVIFKDAATVVQDPNYWNDVNQELQSHGIPASVPPDILIKAGMNALQDVYHEHQEAEAAYEDRNSIEKVKNEEIQQIEQQTNDQEDENNQLRKEMQEENKVIENENQLLHMLTHMKNILPPPQMLKHLPEARTFLRGRYRGDHGDRVNGRPLPAFFPNDLRPPFRPPPFRPPPFRPPPAAGPLGSPSMFPSMLPHAHSETQKYFKPRMYSVGVPPPFRDDVLHKLPPPPDLPDGVTEKERNVSPFLPLGTVIRNIAKMLPLGDPPQPPSGTKDPNTADVNNLMDQIVEDNEKSSDKSKAKKQEETPPKVKPATVVKKPSATPKPAAHKPVPKPTSKPALNPASKTVAMKSPSPPLPPPSPRAAVPSSSDLKPANEVIKMLKEKAKEKVAKLTGEEMGNEIVKLVEKPTSNDKK